MFHSANLISERNAHRYNQTDLAKAAGCKQQEVGDIEAGTKHPLYHYVVAWALMLNKPFWFFEKDEKVREQLRLLCMPFHNKFDAREIELLKEVIELLQEDLRVKDECIKELEKRLEGKL